MDYTFIVIGLIFLFASFTQGFSGFGFQLLSIPLLLFFFDIKHAVPLGALLGLVVNIYLIIQLRESIKFNEIKSLIIGAVVGIPFGVWFLLTADSSVIKFFLGIILFIFVILSLTNFINPTGINRNWGYLFGLFSGMLGGALNTNGPPVLIYFYLKGWDKIKIKASITGLFIFSSILIVSQHAIIGLTTSAIFLDAIKFLPFVLVGQVTGSIIFKKVSSHFYNKFILFALFVISIFLILG